MTAAPLRVLSLAAALFAGAVAPVAAQEKPFGILDNSFLVEEAFNQDKGIFQNIFTWTRTRTGEWEGNFTQEWPAPSITHQLSYAIPFAGGDGSARFGGILLNYRYQALKEGPGRPAFSPRASLILPSGRAVDASDRPGVQVNLPFSKQAGALYVHWNAGFTWLQGVPSGMGGKQDLTSPLLAGSLIWNAKPMINLMLEGTVEFEDTAAARFAGHRDRIVTLSPGLRGGWNLSDDRQIIIGAAVPLTMQGGEHTAAFLAYFSYELPFTSNR